jgi:acyl-coenzyme A synthetase/AMP-(fatty) acid ligase
VSRVIADHAGAKVDNAAVDYDDPCWFFFTSGTTGTLQGGGAHPRPDGLLW